MADLFGLGVVTLDALHSASDCDCCDYQCDCDGDRSDLAGDECATAVDDGDDDDSGD